MDWAIATQIILGVAAVALIVDRFISRRGSEWKDVADSRGEQIEDLQTRVNVLEGTVELLTAAFAEVIATKVVEHIKENTG